MSKLLSTTALILTLGMPSLALAQTQAPTADPTLQQNAAGMSGFLVQRGQSDLFASELMGHKVYAHRNLSDTRLPANKTAPNAGDGRAMAMAMMSRRDLDDMEKIGEVTEIVFSGDGQVRALVIGVGGFLGMGEHDVAVTMDQVTFATDPEDRSETYIVFNIGADRLKDSPAYDRMATGPMNDTRMKTDAVSERTGLAAPQMRRDGYDRVEVTNVSTEMLLGKSVYDVNDNDVGEVTDILVNAEGEITDVIIDFGGFLGIGSRQASLKFDELTMLSTEGYDDIRIYVSATRDQIQNLPQYQASN